MLESLKTFLIIIKWTLSDKVLLVKFSKFLSFTIYGTFYNGAFSGQFNCPFLIIFIPLDGKIFLVKMTKPIGYILIWVVIMTENISGFLFILLCGGRFRVRFARESTITSAI